MTFPRGHSLQDSTIWPDRLFTADLRIIRYTVGFLNDEAPERVTNRSTDIFAEMNGQILSHE